MGTVRPVLASARTDRRVLLSERRRQTAAQERVTLAALFPCRRVQDLRAAVAKRVALLASRLCLRDLVHEQKHSLLCHVCSGRRDRGAVADLDGARPESVEGQHSPKRAIDAKKGPSDERERARAIPWDPTGRGGSGPVLSIGPI